MGLSLKKEEMIKYLEELKAPEETFRCMLWGTVYAKLSSFHDHSVASLIMAFTPAPGVGGFLNNAFCYIGVTDQKIYVAALDSYNTSKIVGTFALPFANITSLKVSKAFGSYIVDIECGEYVGLTVKSTSIGTNIKDQKERMGEFVAAIETLKGYYQ